MQSIRPFRHFLTHYRVLTAVLVIVLSIVFAISNALAATVQEGVLSTAWGDSKFGGEARNAAFLSTDAQEVIRLEPSVTSDVTFRTLHQLSGERARVVTAPAPRFRVNSDVGNDQVSTLKVLSISPVDSETQSKNSRLSSSQSAVFSGSKRYVSLLCKFSDINTEPRSIAYFDSMYGDSPGQLGHYWREVSSDRINLIGSRSYGGSTGASGWFTLPSPVSQYAGSGRDTDLDALFEDCVAQAEPFVDFTQFDGINLMFNTEIGCCAWGGTFTATLDGQVRTIPTTWNPDWAWSEVSVIAHEMGHSFGLPHSNNSDGDNDPYDSPWSVMSYAYGGFTDSVYGLKGIHINSYEKNRLGWLNANEIYKVATNGSTRRIKLSFLSRSQATSGGHRAIIHQISNKDYYIIEARQRGGTYEGLVGTAVIINLVNENREEPAWVVDQASRPADFADTEGVMWRVGETFEDLSNGLTLRIVSVDSTGFTLELTGAGENVPIIGAIQLLLLEE